MPFYAEIFGKLSLFTFPWGRFVVTPLVRENHFFVDTGFKVVHRLRSESVFVLCVSEWECLWLKALVASS
jgi:hypothetical protein